ncbi:hypothetical protein IFVP203_C1140004 [Vibrio parahaemolyticus]
MISVQLISERALRNLSALTTDSNKPHTPTTNLHSVENL